MIWKRMSSTEAIKAVSTLEKKSSDEFYAIVEEWKNGKFNLYPLCLYYNSACTDGVFNR